MKKILKIFFKLLKFNTILQKFGYTIISNNDRNSLDGIFKFIYNDNKNDLNNFQADPRKNINKEIVIFDVGANIGQSIKRFKSIAPNCKIFSYEPHNGFFEILKKNFFEKNIFLFNKALGSKVEKKIINQYPYGASSFYKINLSIKTIKKRFDDWTKNKNNILKKQKTIVSTVDREFKKNKLKKIHILKIDTQGFERECLEGSTRCLKNQLINFIQLEIELAGQYKKNYVSDLDIVLKKKKYTLICFEPKGHNLLNNSQWQAELLYCNQLMLKKIQKFHSLPSYKQFI